MKAIRHPNLPHAVKLPDARFVKNSVNELKYSGEPTVAIVLVIIMYICFNVFGVLFGSSAAGWAVLSLLVFFMHILRLSSAHGGSVNLPMFFQAHALRQHYRYQIEQYRFVGGKRARLRVLTYTLCARAVGVLAFVQHLQQHVLPRLPIITGAHPGDLFNPTVRELDLKSPDLVGPLKLGLPAVVEQAKNVWSNAHADETNAVTVLDARHYAPKNSKSQEGVDWYAEKGFTEVGVSTDIEKVSAEEWQRTYSKELTNTSKLGKAYKRELVKHIVDLEGRIFTVDNNKDSNKEILNDNTNREFSTPPVSDDESKLQRLSRESTDSSSAQSLSVISTSPISSAVAKTKKVLAKVEFEHYSLRGVDKGGLPIGGFHLDYSQKWYKNALETGKEMHRLHQAQDNHHSEPAGDKDRIFGIVKNFRRELMNLAHPMYGWQIARDQRSQKTDGTLDHAEDFWSFFEKSQLKSVQDFTVKKISDHFSYDDIRVIQSEEKYDSKYDAKSAPFRHYTLKDRFEDMMRNYRRVAFSGRAVELMTKFTDRDAHIDLLSKRLEVHVLLETYAKYKALQSVMTSLQERLKNLQPKRAYITPGSIVEEVLKQFEADIAGKFSIREEIVLGLWKPLNKVKDTPLALMDASTFEEDMEVPLQNMTMASVPIPKSESQANGSSASANVSSFATNVESYFTGGHTSVSVPMHVTARAKYSSKQKFYYYSDMDQSKLLIFRHFTRDRFKCNVHGAIQLPVKGAFEKRKSLEMRAKLFYIEEAAVDEYLAQAEIFRQDEEYSSFLEI